MSGFKGIVKGGWHPSGSKDGTKESWRGDFKGVNTVAGWVGKGKDPHEAAVEHQSTPLSSLKDPASFGPPPKHVGLRSNTPPGAPGAADNGMASERRLRPERDGRTTAQEEAPEAAPKPYTVDSTGLSTTHLPKPPLRRLDPPSERASSTSVPSRPKPALPPRLPPRQNSTLVVPPIESPPPYSESDHGLLNRGALNRLGQAGISVPGLDIGRTTSPPVPPRNLSSPSTPGPTVSRTPQLGELQSRFSKMSTSQPTAGEPGNGSGTSLAEKREALRTANMLRTDPTKVSASDLKTASSTASKFYERHGSQVATGRRAANDLSQRYGSLGSGKTENSPAQPPVQSGVAGTAKKPPPPPPPKKKKELESTPREPPPVPLASKPKW